MSQKTKVLIKRATEWVQKKGFDKIKANCESFDTPTSFTLDAEDDTFTPDVTGVQYGTKSYFEVATKEDDKLRTISKWKLLSTLAQRKGGKLFLLTPKGHKSFVEQILKNYISNAELIYLRNW